MGTLRICALAGTIMAFAFAVSPASPASPAPVAPTEPVSHPGSADRDPSNDFLIGPPEAVPDCALQLDRLGVSYKLANLPIKKSAKSSYECGSKDPILYLKGPTKIRFSPAPLLDCGMALALARFEPVLQEESERHLGAKIARITQLGTYACRKMARYDFVSEHSYANAIDLERFVLTNGRQISVLRDFETALHPSSPSRSAFLSRVAERAYDEGFFSVVLTPHFDALHKNHFHLDLARYRLDGTR